MKQFGQEQVETTARSSSSAGEAVLEGILTASVERAPRCGEPTSAAAACCGSSVGIDAADWAECAPTEV